MVLYINLVGNLNCLAAADFILEFTSSSLGLFAFPPKGRITTSVYHHHYQSDVSDGGFTLKWDDLTSDDSLLLPGC